MSQLHCCELAIIEIAANGHTCKVVSHANQESLSGNSSAIFEKIHTCITLCNQSVPGTKPHENNELYVSLPAKRCRPARKMTMALGSFLIRATDMCIFYICDINNCFILSFLFNQAFIKCDNYFVPIPIQF